VKTDRHVIEDVSIEADASASGVIETNGLAVIAIEMPAEWTAAMIGFQAGGAADALSPVYDASGNRVAATVAASRFVAIPMTDSCWGPFLQLESIDAAGDAVAQAADRALRVHLKSYLS
jgi:hypothetical protein